MSLAATDTRYTHVHTEHAKKLDSYNCTQYRGDIRLLIEPI